MIQTVDITQLSANKESSCLDSIHAHDAFFYWKISRRKCQEGNFKEQNEDFVMLDSHRQTDRQDSRNHLVTSC
jgi:hypothetical protein